MPPRGVAAIMDWDQQFKLVGVDLDHPAMQLTLPLVWEDEDGPRFVGTAFAVAPGLAITAEHVIGHGLKRQELRDGYKRAGAMFSLTALQMFEGRILPWVVDAIYASRSADVAFLRFQRPGWWGDEPGQLKPPCARLNFNPPSPGQELRLFGFPSSEVRDGVLYITPAECLARVKSVDLTTTESGLPESHIKLDGTILGGMSGGPSLDSDWNVIGVISCGWSFMDAHVALLWPAMAIQIDLFKTGSFPAINLFEEGPARAIGFQRVYVTSDNQARLAKVDRKNLVPIPHLAGDEHLQIALNFAASNAQKSLAEARVLLDQKPLNIDGLHRTLRSYFWELDAALRIALALSSLRNELAVDGTVDWDRLVAEWRHHVHDEKVLDEIAALDFSWHGVELFEVRTYAEYCRFGALPLMSLTGEGRNDYYLKQCWGNGSPVPLPGGLDRYLDSSRRFVQNLLCLSVRRVAGA